MHIHIYNALQQTFGEDLIALYLVGSYGTEHQIENSDVLLSLLGLSVQCERVSPGISTTDVDTPDVPAPRCPIPP